MSYKIGVIGHKDVVLPFKLMGFDVFDVHEAAEARRKMQQLAKEEYGIIYVTENIAAQIPETIAHYDTMLIPAIILIPDHFGSLGIGKKRIADSVEKAVGQNIL